MTNHTTILSQPEANDKALDDSATIEKVPTCQRPGSLIDLDKPEHFTIVVVLSCALREAMGGYPPSQETNIVNGIWTMVEDYGISLESARAFYRAKMPKATQQGKKVLDAWWQAMVS